MVNLHTIYLYNINTNAHVVESDFTTELTLDVVDQS